MSWWTAPPPEPEPKPKRKRKKPKDTRMRVEARIYIRENTIELTGYVDELELTRDYIDSSTAWDVMKTYVVGKKRFKMTGTVEPWS